MEYSENSPLKIHMSALQHFPETCFSQELSTAHLIPYGDYPAIKFIDPYKDTSGRHRPFLRHILRSTSPIFSIKKFPFSSTIMVGSLDSLFCLKGSSIEMSIYIEPKEHICMDSIDVHPSEGFVACKAPNNSLRICSLGTGSTVFKCNNHRNVITSVFFAPFFSRVCSTSLDGTIIMTDLIRKKLCCRYKAFDSISTASLRHDETIIAVGSTKGNIKLFDNRHENSATNIDAHTDWVNSIDFCAADYSFASTGIDRSMKLWDLRQPEQPVMADTRADYGIRRVLFPRDMSELFAVCNNGMLMKYNSTEGRKTGTMMLKSCGILACDIDISEKIIIISTEDMIMSTFSY